MLDKRENVNWISHRIIQMINIIYVTKEVCLHGNTCLQKKPV